MTTPWLIVGAAACVWDDLAAARRLGISGGPVICVNRMMADYPGTADLGVTLHPEMLPLLTGGRSMRRVFSHRAGTGISDVLPWRPGWQGTSALYAVEVALHLGARRVILAGCPIDGGAHYYDTKALADWLELYRAGWRCARREIAGTVKSLSGWTRAMLGAPTREWVEA